jgi:OmcA/MtrC family decaheme c-type cytochrome
VGPGLNVQILSATAPATGPATVTFKMTDAAGFPVDFLNELTAGNFGTTRGPRFSLAQSPAAGEPYEALYESARAGQAGGKQSAGTQVPGSISLADARLLYTEVTKGTYTFTFPTAAPALPTLAAGYPLAPVQTSQTLVAIQASRSFDGVSYPAGASLEFMPNGGTVTARQVVTDAACNQCHKALTAHGSRRTVNLCLTCHTPGWVQDPTANNTANHIDFRRMIHQIHRGQQPTDVQNVGNPYVYKWSATNDFSTVAFAPPNTVRNCVMCHQGGAQSDNWKNKPSRIACGSCHYAVNFDTGAGHVGGPQTDAACLLCHKPDDDFVAPSTTRVHSFLYDALTNSRFNGANLGLTINSINTTNPTASTVTFTVTRDGAPADIKTTPLDNLRFTIAGPTSDYGGPNGLGEAKPLAAGETVPRRAGYVQSVQYGGAAGAALLVATATPGQFTAALPDLTTANGQSVGVGAEAYVLETGTCSLPPCATREWPASEPTPVRYARVGGGTVTARRAITDAAKCDACHLDLGFHGGEARKGPDYCAMCHNSQNVNDERTSQFEANADGTAFSKTPGTVQLSRMIHKIHKGSERVPSDSLPNPRPTYTLGATRNFNADAATGRAEGEAPDAEFGHQFPGDIKDCQTCHIPGGYGLPEANVLATRIVTFTCLEAVAADTNAVCGTLSASGGVVAPDTVAGDAFWTKVETFIPAGQAHCGSCHDGTVATAHIASNTLPGGIEACDACHGDGRFMDPIQIHGRGRP